MIARMMIEPTLVIPLLFVLVTMLAVVILATRVSFGPLKPAIDRRVGAARLKS